MKGVVNGSVSAGSSRGEASVTWSPHVRVPSGAAIAGRVMSKNSGNARNRMRKRELNRLMGPSCPARRSRARSGSAVAGNHQPEQHFIAEGSDLPLRPDKGLNQDVQPFQETVPIAAHPCRLVEEQRMGPQIDTTPGPILSDDPGSDEASSRKVARLRTQSMTWSARCCSGGRIVSPSAFAVLR